MEGARPDPPAARGPTVIELCGSMRVELAGRQVASSLPGRQGRMVFAYLVVNRRRPVGRGELLEVLWPGAAPGAPDAGLNTVLARVRRAVGPGVIDGRGELRLRLPPDAEIDIERARAQSEVAERRLAGGDLETAAAAAHAALEIVERPLLPGIEGSWVETCRSELAGLEPGLLEVLARAALAVGDREHLATAERVASRLAERHPFRESGYVLLMEIHARRGNAAEATLTYDRLRCRLRDELGTVPSPSVSALHDQLLRTGRGPPGGPYEPPPAGSPGRGGAGASVPLPVIGGVVAGTRFVGREAHLERLRQPWLEADAGERRFSLLVGEPGVGKTRLAAQFAAEVHRAGATVLYGRCDEEPLLAYQPLVQALRHYLQFGDWQADPACGPDLGQLARLLPETRPESVAGGESFAPDPESERFLLFEAVTRLVGRASRVRPLLLILDDLHWADKPTLLLLRHMMRLTDPARLMVLGVFRDVDVDAGHPLVELVADLRWERRVERHALEGLDEQETDALVAARLDAQASPGFVRGLRTQTEGNPFFIEEALRSLLEARAVESGEAASEQALTSIGVPDSVADVILRRLGRVSSPTREVLSAAAVIGREIDIKIAAALLDLPAERILEAMEEAMTAGLVGEVAGLVDRFMFSHALVRNAIYGRLSRSRRVRLHLRVGEALEQAAARGGGAGPGELAHHFFLARELGGAARAVGYAVQAGDEAARSLAYEEAAAHYRRALEAFALDTAGDEAARCDILLALGRVQWQAGDAAARETYFEAADSAGRRGAARQLAYAALGLGERYWEAGGVDRRHHELLARALDVLSAEDSTPRVRVMARMAENLHFTAPAEGAALSLEALAMARRIGGVNTLITALMGRHVALLHIEHLDERLRLIDEILALAEGRPALVAEAHHWRLFDLCELGDLTEAHRDHAALAALARELRQPLLEHLALGWQGTFAHLAGDVEEAERLAGRSSDVAGRAQVTHPRNPLASMLFTLRRHQGRLGELLPAIRALAAGGSASLAWSAALVVAEVETGAVERGEARYERLAGGDFAAIPRDWYWSGTTALLAEMCVAVGDIDRAPVLYALLEPFADRFVQIIFTTCWGSVARYLGLLAGAMDRFDLAERHFEAALAGNARMGAVLMTAETQCAYGAMLLRRDRPGDRERAAGLGALAERIAAPRGLDGLCSRARGLVAGRRGSPL